MVFHDSEEVFALYISSNIDGLNIEDFFVPFGGKMLGEAAFVLF